MDNDKEIERTNEDNYIECPKCERRVKESDKECPYCQYNLINRPKIEKEEMETYKKWLVGGLLAIIVIVIVGISISSDNANTTTSANTTSKTNNTSNNTKNTTTKIEKAKVTIVDFSQMSKEDIQNWCNTNKVVCNITEEYSDTIEKGAFVSQSVNANSMIHEGDKVAVVYSLGKEPTLGQKNALKSAKDYIKTMPFSYTGLIKQLKYEGYSNEEATYGADNCEANWNEQAAKSARDYINTMSFSRSGLIKQLKYEGFTNEQAEYGATLVGY